MKFGYCGVAWFWFKANSMVERIFRAAKLSLIFLLILPPFAVRGEATKLVVAYSSPAATFSPGWIAKRGGIFAKYNLDVEMVLMQGPSTYMPALASGNIQVMYGGGTAISRAIGTGGFDLVVLATETRYIPLRMMVNPAIRNPQELKGRKLGVGRAGLDEYGALLYLDKVGLIPGKDVQLVYLAGGIPNRATAMKQGLVDGVVVNPSGGALAANPLMVAGLTPASSRNTRLSGAGDDDNRAMDTALMATTATAT